MPKLIWEMKLQEVVKFKLFTWSVRNMIGEVFVKRYYPDINKKLTTTPLIIFKPNQDFNVLNAMKKINEVLF